MKIIKTADSMQKIALEFKKSGLQVGFVPTMGALHEGHLSLIKASLDENDTTIVSIFVNALQFSVGEDLSLYPKPIEQDIELLSDLEINYLFLPDKENMYPIDFSTYLNVEQLCNKLCGISRPIFFKGVTTICAKLFNIILPDKCYFGQKDYQQSIIIEKMISDLHFPIKMRILPIVRDKTGLALSSRNAYLSKDERKEANRLYQSLEIAKTLILTGERSVKKIKQTIANHLNAYPVIKIDYISLCHPKSLEDFTILNKGKVLIAIAIFIRQTRLIDNAIVAILD